MAHPEQFVLPGTLPLILLGECYHFPGCDLPLRIFEERYRRMLDDALETDRVFGVGVRVNEKGLFPYATAGLIRSSVLSKDGTSQVILRGLQRVQITGIRQVEPYVIAEVTPVRPVAGGVRNLRAGGKRC
jgi:Lon protease-like protein